MRWGSLCKGAPTIAPKPILDGWKLLESTAIYRAAGKNPFFGPDAKDPSVGQILLMSKEGLQHLVLTDPRVDIYSCGRDNIKAGEIDRRVLATIEFLASSGMKPTITSLKCGHSYLTTSGNVFISLKLFWIFAACASRTAGSGHELPRL